MQHTTNWHECIHTRIPSLANLTNAFLLDDGVFIIIGQTTSVKVSLSLPLHPFCVVRLQVFIDITMVLYKYLHVVFMLPIYSHDFSISFNQAMFARKRDFVMIT